MAFNEYNDNKGIKVARIESKNPFKTEFGTVSVMN